METKLGVVLTYIPTNVVPTFGFVHIGIQPSINVEIFVSRTGFGPQLKALKHVDDNSKLELAQFAELVRLMLHKIIESLVDFSQHGMSKVVTSMIGVKQGCPLSNPLFQSFYR